jgi:hypothetical protein
MFTQQISETLLNIIPFWSSNIVLILGLGNEYTVALNLILTQLLKLFFSNINDVGCIIFLLTIFIFVGMFKFGFKINYKIFNKNIVVLTAIENDTDNKNHYSNKINMINYYLLNILKINNIRYCNDMTILVNDLTNYKIHDNIYLTIIRKIETYNNKSFVLVNYTLWSYHENIVDFIDLIENTYKNKINNSEVTIIGDETDSKLNYPIAIHALNNYVSINYQIPKLKCMLNNEVNTNKTCNKKKQMRLAIQLQTKKKII